MRTLAAAFAASLAKSRPLLGIPLGENPLTPLFPAEERAQFVQNVLDLSATRSFGTIPLIELFGSIGLPAEAIYDRARRATVYDLVHDYWDARMGAAIPPSPSPLPSPQDTAATLPPPTSIRDAVFDLAMNRFEAMEERRRGAISLLDWPRRSLAGPPVMAHAALRTARRLLFLAGLESVPADPRHAALAIVLWRAEHAWRADESGDFARLMARLDGDLRQIEDIARRVTTFGQRQGTAPL